jgi:colicin import membrane protein
MEPTKELTKIVTDSGLQLNEGEQIKQSYLPYFEQLAEIKHQAAKIDFENPSEIDEGIARQLRLKTVKIRTGSESIKDDRKRIHTLKANLEQSAWNLIKSTCLLEEENFLQVEKRREMLEKQRINDLRQTRLSTLASLGLETDVSLGLGILTDEEFDAHRDGLLNAKEEKEKAEAKAEADRIAKERKEAQEREKIRLENERLKKEAAKREKELAQERAAADKKLAEARKEQEAAEKKLQAEKAKAEAAKKLADEKARKEREQAAAKLREEQAAKAKLEAEIKAKADQEARAKKEAEEKAAAELKAKQLAEKKAAAAPRKKKLTSWVEGMGIVAPQGLSDDPIVEEIMTKFEGFKTWANSQIQKI